MSSRTQLDKHLEAQFQQRPQRRAVEAPSEDEQGGRRRNPDLCEIRLSRIKPARNQVRRLNKGPDNPRTKELAESIKQQGVLQPITVRYIAKGDYFEIVAGERRYWGATLAKLDVVPCVVKNYDQDAAARAQLAENIHRENLTPIEIGKALKRRLDRGDTVAQLMAFTSKGKSWVSRHISIATKLSASAVQEASHPEDPLTAVDALYEVSQIPKDQQAEMVVRIRDQQLNVEQIKAEVAPLKNIGVGRPQGRRNYATSITVDGAVVTIRFAKTRATNEEVVAKLNEAIRALKPVAKSRNNKATD